MGRPDTGQGRDPTRARAAPGRRTHVGGGSMRAVVSDSATAADPVAARAAAAHRARGMKPMRRGASARGSGGPVGILSAGGGLPAGPVDPRPPAGQAERQGANPGPARQVRVVRLGVSAMTRMSERGELRGSDGGSGCGSSSPSPLQPPCSSHLLPRRALPPAAPRWPPVAPRVAASRPHQLGEDGSGRRSSGPPVPGHHPGGSRAGLTGVACRRGDAVLCRRRARGVCIYMLTAFCSCGSGMLRALCDGMRGSPPGGFSRRRAVHQRGLPGLCPGGPGGELPARARTCNHYPAERSSQRPSHGGRRPTEAEPWGQAAGRCGGFGMVTVGRAPPRQARQRVPRWARICTTTRLSGAHRGRARGGQAAGRYVFRPAGQFVHHWF